MVQVEKHAGGRATRKIVNVGQGAGPQAWCYRCGEWKRAGQVAWEDMGLNARGEVVATYALLPHEVERKG